MRATKQVNLANAFRNVHSTRAAQAEEQLPRLEASCLVPSTGYSPPSLRGPAPQANPAEPSHPSPHASHHSSTASLPLRAASRLAGAAGSDGGMEIDEAVRGCSDCRMRTKYGNAVYVVQRAFALYP